ncbi:MAG: hypothetical protein A4E44_00041 [Methanosaeta sp. PtaB.Bin018]|nr:MAG: hypothetical protein A4E44_00041 [Methanosaeta sp. PtaB.Bin018]
MRLGSLAIRPRERPPNPSLLIIPLKPTSTPTRQRDLFTWPRRMSFTLTTFKPSISTICRSRMVSVTRNSFSESLPGGISSLDTSRRISPLMLPTLEMGRMTLSLRILEV